MLDKWDNKLNNLDKIQIGFSVGIKLLRGFFLKNHFKNTKGSILVGRNTSILNKQYITIGKNVKFEKNSEIQGLSKKGVNLGNNVTIGHSAMIRPSSYYGVKDIGEGMAIGNNSSIGPFSYIGCGGYIKIGSNVMIGPRVSLFAENHNFINHNLNIKSQGVHRNGIIIEDDCWLGSGVIVLDGVSIGKGSVIAAGTLIAKDVEPGSIVMDVRSKSVTSR